MMPTQFYLVLLISSNFVYFLRADDFSCPTYHITKDIGVSGIIPLGAANQVKIPAETDCTYVFDIPKGFAIKVATSTVYDDALGDSIIISSPAENVIEFAINESLHYTVVSVTGNLTFMAFYTYVDLRNYKQVIKPTGTYFNVSLEPNKYFTIKTSTDTDKVNLKHGSRSFGISDWSTYQVFLFDENDIFNSEYIGRVNPSKGLHSEIYSSSNTLTLVNLANGPSDSLFLGNDASTVKKSALYDVYVIDSDKQLHGWMDSFYQTDAWYTFICDGCSSFSMDSLKFNRRFENSSGYVEVQGMSPTQRLPAMLNYLYSSNTNSSLPQLIPSPMATFHIYNASIEFLMAGGTQKEDFAAAPGKTKFVYSPQLWNPDAQPKFNYTFSDPVDASKVYNFSINLKTIELENDGDELNVQIESVNGITTLDKKYTKTKIVNQMVSGIGRYLNLKYNGSKTSEVILSFQMIDTLNPHEITTTQSSGSTNSSSSTSISTVSSSKATSLSTRATRVSTSTAPLTSKVASSTVSSTVQSSTASLTITTTVPKSSAITTLFTSTNLRVSTSTAPLISKTAISTASSTVVTTTINRQSSTVTTLLPSTSPTIETTLTTKTGSASSTVETTTKSATSLLPTGVFIIAFSVLTF